MLFTVGFTAGFMLGMTAITVLLWRTKEEIEQDIPSVCERLGLQQETIGWMLFVPWLLMTAIILLSR